MKLPSFTELLEAWPWRPIRHCPGRYVLGGSHASPAELLGVPCAVEELASAGCPDRVLVVLLPGGGLLSYAKSDGSYVHTLNTAEGLQRKLAQLGIVLHP